MIPCNQLISIILKRKVNQFLKIKKKKKKNSKKFDYVNSISIQEIESIKPFTYSKDHTYFYTIDCL